MNQNQATQRTFVIGDEWLYYKFYTGPKTADMVLTQVIKPVVDQLMADQIIDKWFFIRYSDPKLHIRVRFHYTDPQNIFPITQAIFSHAKPFIEKDLIWKVMIDTYQRELERYGYNTMELSESYFCCDSILMMNMLDLIEGDEGEIVRWLFGLRSLDALLNDFRYELPKKVALLTTLQENFGREFGMGRGLKMQLDAKFRKERSMIDEVLDRTKDSSSQMLPLFNLIEERSKLMHPIADQILNIEKEEKLGRTLNDLMSSYIHMMLNRLFKSKQRLHELVIYDFLLRYYKSEVAKQKNKQQ